MSLLNVEHWVMIINCFCLGKTALETGHSSGKVVVKSKQSGQKLVIPYTSTVLAGGLSYDSQITRFRSDSAQIPARPFHLTNNYKVPVAITNANLSKDASKHFEVCSSLQ